MYGRYFEDFKIGELIFHEPAKTVTESDNNLFCLLTMNHHPLHSDDIYAAKTQHGRKVVVGTYVLSLIVGMTVANISGKAIANLNYSRIEHLRPVFIGDTLHAITRVTGKKCSRTKSDRGIVKVRTAAVNQEGLGVLALEREILVPRRKQ